MTSFKDSFINTDAYLLGVCFKPATFSDFYDYFPQHILTNDTVEFENPVHLKSRLIIRISCCQWFTIDIDLIFSNRLIVSAAMNCVFVNKFSILYSNCFNVSKSI